MLLHSKWDTELEVSGHSNQRHSKEEKINNKVHKKLCEGTMEARRMLSKMFENQEESLDNTR